MKKFILLTTFAFATALSASAQGTAFTYQGRLNDAKGPANGTYDIAYTLYATNINGTPIAGPVTNSAIGVTNGLFTTLINFGPGVFVGDSTWLDLAVRTNGAPTFTELTPREQIAPVPYALFAASASNVSGSIPASQVSGTLMVTQLPAAVVTNGESGVNLSGAVTLGGNLYLPRLTTTNGIIYTGGLLLMHGNGDALYNFFTGPNAGNVYLTGAFNSGFGTLALELDTTGSWNTASGYEALNENTSGSYNTGVGYGALELNTTGYQNTAIGAQALIFNTIGTNNTATGVNALEGNTSGYDNTAFGYDSLAFNSTGADNTAVGGHALWSNTTGYENTATGFDALIYNTTGVYNTANGATALYNNTTGFYNTANGAVALFYNTTGSNNTANGEAAMYFNSTGIDNTAMGQAALELNTSGNYNTAVGANALLSNTIGIYNTANGYNALYSSTNGAYNTASGYEALYSTTSGLNEIAVGVGSLYANTTGYNNVGIGCYALQQLTTGVNNIAMGYQAGFNFTGAESGNIDIGNLGVAGENNIIRIGTGQTKAIFPSGCTVYTGSVALTSDRNAKANFSQIDPLSVLAKVVSLPVTQWNYKTDGTEVRHLGPMAQDFHTAFGLDGEDDKHISVIDEGGVALAAIQGLNQKVEQRDAEILTLKQNVNELKKLMRALAEKK